MIEKVTLRGNHVRLEPLELGHARDLTTAALVERTLYQWSPVPENEDDFARYIETAISWRDDGTALPFVIVRQSDGAIVGSTRFWNIERWAWPKTHPRAERDKADACEIGYTWLTRDAVGTLANTEAKFLMLEHAFVTWGVLRVCLHTDARNQRSRRAMERIGAKFEGVLRAHKIATDATPRDSHRYSIVADEWPAVKARL